MNYKIVRVSSEGVRSGMEKGIEAIEQVRIEAYEESLAKCTTQKERDAVIALYENRDASIDYQFT